jgi:hypothetical protein
VKQGKALFAAFSILTVMFAPAFGKIKPKEGVQHAPIPAKVLAAKTIFIQNESDHADTADKAYTQLKEWGRFQITDTITDTREKADIILVLSVTSEQSETTRAESTSFYNYKTGAWTQGTVPTSETITWRYSQVKLVDPTSGNIEWSDQMVQRRKYSATEELIKGLRQRVEEQEKQTTPDTIQHLIQFDQ